MSEVINVNTLECKDTSNKEIHYGLTFKNEEIFGCEAYETLRFGNGNKKDFETLEGALKTLHDVEWQLSEITDNFENGGTLLFNGENITADEFEKINDNIQ